MASTKILNIYKTRNVFPHKTIPFGISFKGEIFACDNGKMR